MTRTRQYSYAHNAASTLMAAFMAVSGVAVSDQIPAPPQPSQPADSIPTSVLAEQKPKFKYIDTNQTKPILIAAAATDLAPVFQSAAAKMVYTAPTESPVLALAPKLLAATEPAQAQRAPIVYASMKMDNPVTVTAGQQKPGYFDIAFKDTLRQIWGIGNSTVNGVYNIVIKPILKSLTADDLRDQKTLEALVHAKNTQSFNSRKLGAFAYIESRFGKLSNTYGTNKWSSALGLFQITKIWMDDHFYRYGDQIPELKDLHAKAFDKKGNLRSEYKDEVYNLRLNDKYMAELVAIVNAKNATKINNTIDDFKKPLPQAENKDHEMAAHEFIIHNIGGGGYNKFMKLLRNNPNGKAAYTLGKSAKNNPQFFYEYDDNGKPLYNKPLSATDAYKRYLEEIKVGMAYYDMVVAKNILYAPPAPDRPDRDQKPQQKRDTEQKVAYTPLM